MDRNRAGKSDVKPAFLKAIFQDSKIPRCQESKIEINPSFKIARTQYRKNDGLEYGMKASWNDSKNERLKPI